MKKIILILIPLFFLCTMGYAQVEEENDFQVFGKDTVFPLRDGRILFNEKIYKENSSYLTMAYGLSKNFTYGGLEQNLMISYHHFLENIGLSIGYHSSRDTIAWGVKHFQANDLWLGAGWRYEKLRYNLGVFAGPSYSWGNYVDWSEEDGTNRLFGYSALGGMVEIQLTYRILYDIGLGFSLYGSKNKYYSVAGAQLHLFFSTAFVRNY